jgi:hypothetical protein
MRTVYKQSAQPSVNLQDGTTALKLVSYKVQADDTYTDRESGEVKSTPNIKLELLGKSAVKGLYGVPVSTKISIKLDEGGNLVISPNSHLAKLLEKMGHTFLSEDSEEVPSQEQKYDEDGDPIIEEEAMQDEFDLLGFLDTFILEEKTFRAKLTLNKTFWNLDKTSL